MGVAVRLHGKVIGVICHEHTGPARKWILEEQDFAASIADMVSVALEAMERKRAEEALKESERQLRTLINSMPDIVCFKDGEGRWLEANEADIRLFRLEGVDYRGKKDSELAEFTHPIYRDVFLLYEENDEKAWAEGSLSRSEERIPQPDGGVEVFDIIRVPLLSSDGERMGLIVLGRNITERKKMEEELLTARKLESVGILAGGIAHDFNNLLTAILGNVSLARMSAGLEGKVSHLLQEAEKATLRAKDLTQQLLIFSKGGAPIKKTVFTDALIKDSAGFVLSGSNVKCEYYLAEDLWSVEVDEGQMNQVINNLIINADQAMPEGGLINVRAENVTLGTGDIPSLKEGHYVRVLIKDQGIGRSILQRYLIPTSPPNRREAVLGWPPAIPSSRTTRD
ncbi:Sensor kinase CckA [subsurface metagenome]